MSKSSTSMLRRPTVVAGLAVAVALATAFPVPALAATTYTATGVGVSVAGSTVTATAKVFSSAATSAEVVGFCARDADDKNVDFATNAAAQLTSSGSTIKRTDTFAAGTYTYFVCVENAGVWHKVGTSHTFAVAATGSGSAAPGGVAMPVGDLPGWKQTFSEDFTKTLARGSFPGAYASKWMSYDGFTDTAKTGTYNQKIISAQNGNLDLYLHGENGQPLTAAPVPLINGAWGGQTYGRFSVRMKTDAVNGYKTAFLLWSDANNWNDGEIDFPESALTDNPAGYSHCPGHPNDNCLAVGSTTSYTGWHTYTIDWTAKKLSFTIDGTVIGSTTTNIPTKPLHWVMQTETTGDKTVANANSGHVLIDWATIYSPS